jgi:hypothetical protein
MGGEGLPVSADEIEAARMLEHAPGLQMLMGGMIFFLVAIMVAGIAILFGRALRLPPARIDPAERDGLKRQVRR